MGCRKTLALPSIAHFQYFVKPIVHAKLVHRRFGRYDHRAIGGVIEPEDDPRQVQTLERSK